MRGSNVYLMGKHYAIFILGLLVPCAVLLVVAIILRKEPYFGRDLYRNQMKIESQVPGRLKQFLTRRPAYALLQIMMRG